MHLDSKRFFRAYDIDAITYKYGRLGSPSGHPVSGKNGVETSGSSVTVTATDGTPFDPVNVGDVIVFLTPPDTQTIRRVATKTSGSQITVDSAVTLAEGTMFFFYPFKLGATVNDGWHHVGSWQSATVYVEITTLNSTGGVDVSVEGGGEQLGGGPVPIVTSSFSTTGRHKIEVPQLHYPFMRVGLKVGAVVAGDVVDVWATGKLQPVGV